MRSMIGSSHAMSETLCLESLHSGFLGWWISKLVRQVGVGWKA